MSNATNSPIGEETNSASQSPPRPPDRRVPQFNKAAFFRDVGYEPHDGQKQVHESTALRRVLACGVRWGKTKCAAAEALAAMMQPREHSMGWICAPTYELSEKMFREIVMIAAEHLRHRIVVLKEHEKRLILRNMAGGLSEMRGKSADNMVSLLGEGLDWLVVDEAAQLKPVVWQSYLSQRLIDRKGWALLISTPKGKGWYFDLFRRGQVGVDPDFESWNCPSWSNPYLDRALIEAERERIPDRVFRQEYGGQFLEGSGQVFRSVRECATGSFSPPVKDAYYYAGLDLAKVEDYTVLVIIDNKCRVVYVDRFNRIDWHFQVSRLKGALDRYNHATVLVDSTGKGEPVFETLRKEGCRATPYTFSSKSKAVLIDNLSLMLEQRLVTLPKPDLCPELIDELESFEYSVTDSGTTRTSAPSGVHDDCVVALALALWQRRPTRPVPKITWVSGDFMRPGWLNPGLY
jgi:hypothetical protein